MLESHAAMQNGNKYANDDYPEYHPSHFTCTDEFKSDSLRVRIAQSIAVNTYLLCQNSLSLGGEGVQQRLCYCCD